MRHAALRFPNSLGLCAPQNNSSEEGVKHPVCCLDRPSPLAKHSYTPIGLDRHQQILYRVRGKLRRVGTWQSVGRYDVFNSRNVPLCIGHHLEPARKKPADLSTPLRFGLNDNSSSAIHLSSRLPRLAVGPKRSVERSAVPPIWSERPRPATGDRSVIRAVLVPFPV